MSHRGSQDSGVTGTEHPSSMAGRTNSTASDGGKHHQPQSGGGGIARFGGTHPSSCLSNRYSSPNINLSGLSISGAPAVSPGTGGHNNGGGSCSGGCSPNMSRESSPMMLKRALGHSMHHSSQSAVTSPMSSQHHQSHHDRLHATLRRSNSLKRILKMPLFGGQGKGGLSRAVCSILLPHYCLRDS